MNTRGLRLGARVQNIFTVAKIAALSGLTLLGFAFATPAARHANFSNFWRNASLLWITQISSRRKYGVGQRA